MLRLEAGASGDAGRTAAPYGASVVEGMCSPS